MQPGCTVLSLWGSLLPAQCMLDIWQWRELWWVSESPHELVPRGSAVSQHRYKWLLPSQILPSTSFCVNKEKENIIFTAVGANPKISQWQGLLSWAVCSKVKHEIGVYSGICWLGKGRFNQSSETPTVCAWNINWINSVPVQEQKFEGLWRFLHLGILYLLCLLCTCIEASIVARPFSVLEKYWLR